MNSVIATNRGCFFGDPANDAKYLCIVEKTKDSTMETKMIGSKIAQARKKTSMSQAQLAERLFISPQAVGKWERGESTPDILTINRLAEILSVDLNYFSENFQSVAAGGAPALPAGRPVEPLVRGTDELPSLLASPERFAEASKTGKERSWNMSRANLVDTDFSGLKNLHEKFTDSNMQRCLFLGSDLSGLLLKGNNVVGCDFSGSDISRSQIQSSNLSGNKFKNCSLKETEFSKSFSEGCDFSGSDFSRVEFSSGGFGSNIVTDVIWNGTSFIASHIVDLVFEGTLKDCHFEGCTFHRTTFQNATLSNTFFKDNKKLKQVRFIDCKVDKLTFAFLKSGGADLSGITLLTGGAGL